MTVVNVAPMLSSNEQILVQQWNNRKITISVNTTVWNLVATRVLLQGKKLDRVLAISMRPTDWL